VSGVPTAVLKTASTAWAKNRAVTSERLALKDPDASSISDGSEFYVFTLTNSKETASTQHLIIISTQ
jgi:hypothetical protein